MENLQLRQYLDTDKEIVWKLHVDGLTQTGTFVKDRSWDDDLLDIKNHYSNNNGDFIIATIADTVVGMGGLRKIDETTCEIKRMRVSVDYQRLGIGTIILEQLLAKAKAYRYKRVILDTSINQQAARKLYEKYGFKEYKRGNVEHLEILYFEKYL